MAKRRRFHKVRARARALGRGAGLKSSGIELLSGAAAGLVAGMAAERVDFLRSKWFVTPLVSAAGGHFLKSVNRDAGAGVVGAAGAMAYFNYKLAKAAETSGVQEVGDMPDYVAAFRSLPDTRGVQEVSVGTGRPRSSVMGL